MKANIHLFLVRPCGIIAFMLFLSVAALAGPRIDPDEKTNRPMRKRGSLVLTVGQGEGDFQGKDDKIIQAAIDYLERLGGGTLRLLPGTYTLQNSIYLRPNISLQGSGETTILEKSDSVVTALARDADWYEYGIQVKDTKGFVAGGGIMLRAGKGVPDYAIDVFRATVVGIRENVLSLDQVPQKNFWVEKDATAATVFPLVTAEHVNDVVIKDIVLDGRRDKNEHINGNFSGAFFIQYCNRWRFENVIARDYNGDGFSFQVCDDIQFRSCRANHNADLGFHAGSGSQRPVFRDCSATRNNLGLYFCWGVSDGKVENCMWSENIAYGVSIGHRDTDNLIRNCTIERNGEAGILFRNEGKAFLEGHRNTIENCTIRDTGVDKPGVGIDIQGETQDILIDGATLENTANGKQETGIRISKESQRIVIKNNTFPGCRTPVDDLRRTTGGNSVKSR